MTVLTAGCTQSAENNTDSARYGDTVEVYYTGTLDDGTVFDQSVKGNGTPLKFVLGKKQMISGFEKAVVGMKEGEIKTVTLTPDEAYGERDENLTFIAGRDQFPESFELEKGKSFGMSGNDGSVYQVTITDFNESEVTLDANHPLAGKNLTFEITLDKLISPR
ncbi:peptidylprolyl isomerase [Methanoplanus sp. FWC-SCC4]|uniref:Peptidyl-prolyl cis-trans isomerase n=2 Tax=Methanochimaera problematica TaxID=2609417 RepID=A0AA97FDA6_9EURY|nr:peptidylprolyl isomerase [Methanoplanus sp. FWC-SCC4]